jgi:hypothetical protein
MPRRSKSEADLRIVSFLSKAFFAILFVVVAGPSALSKEVPLSAIELFDGPNGASYVQITGLLINGKTELRACGGATQINKSNYGKLAKIALTSAVTSLERDPAGTMNLKLGTESQCVVPSNLKFEKDETLTPAQLAERAVLDGTIVGSSPAGIRQVPPFKATVKLVFVPAPDVELAEYLKADRARSIAGWQDYLSRYSKTGHTDPAKQSLAALLLKQGEDSLAAYRGSAASNSPAYAQLKAAYLLVNQAHELLPSGDAARKLGDSCHAELALLTDKSRAELAAYRQALANHTPGYVHLSNSRQVVDQVVGIDPGFAQATAQQAAEAAETKRVEAALESAGAMAASGRYDDAVAAIGDFRSFAEEEPRIAVVIDGAYKYHWERGKADVDGRKWGAAVDEFKQASALKTTPEAAKALAEAQSNLETSNDQASAAAALEQSTAFQQDKRFIEAYEVLAGLTEAQRALVKDQMQALEPDYAKSASDEAKKLLDAHNPIQGRVDEIGVQRAHELLERACALQPDDQNLKLRRDLISQTLSDYYVARAKLYLDKPLGSGVGIAWLYLNEAQQYQPNRDDVRDERTKFSAVHNIRSTLSIKVVFRDQTSRRDSAGFADMLSDAIATGLETTTLPVRIIRNSDSTPTDPNFQLIGDVLEHRPITKPTVESLDSEYRAAEREVPNEDWNKTNRDYETAKLDLQKAQTALEGAQARGKKKDITTASEAVDDAQKKVEDLGRKLDSIPKTTLTDVVKPYSYTKRTIDLSAEVELGFRIVDSNNNMIASNPSIRKSAQEQFVVLENVKPEDTKNVKQTGAAPDEAQFLGDVEIGARTALIKDVKEKIETLPSKILAQARKHLMDGDTDGTAESYILYLNSTPDTPSAERDEAKKFLREQFNMVWPGTKA